MTEIRTFSVLLNWSDGDPEQGTFGCYVRAANEDDAEAKAREEMRRSHLSQYGFDGAEEDGAMGGSVVEMAEGAIWLALELETALRRLLASVDETAARTGWADHGEREAARKVLAEIDGIERAP